MEVKGNDIYNEIVKFLATTYKVKENKISFGCYPKKHTKLSFVINENFSYYNGENFIVKANILLTFKTKDNKTLSQKKYLTFTYDKNQNSPTCISCLTEQELEEEYVL